MTPSQISYYNSLAESEQLILKIAALKASAFVEYHIVNLSITKKVTQKYAKGILNKAAQHALLRVTKNYTNEYSASPDFMVYIYPQMANLKAIWKAAMNGYNEYSPLAQFRNCLYSLLHAPSEYPRHELSFSQNLTSEKIGYYAILIQAKEYEHVLHMINPELLNAALISVINLKIHTLESLSRMKEFCDIIQRSYGGDKINFSQMIDGIIAMQAGKFEKVLETQK